MPFPNPFGKSRPDRKEDAPDQPPQPTETGGATDLTEVVASLLGALIGAQRSLDSASAELAKIYWADPVLRSLPVPVFSMPQVTVHLKFAVLQVEPSPAEVKTPTMRVIVDTPSLNKLPAHLVSQLEFKVTPQSVRIYKADGGEIMLGQA